MRTAFISIIFVFVSFVLPAQDASRLTDWSISGIRTPISEPVEFIDFISKGANANGTMDNAPLLSEILSELPVSGAIISFGPGVFRFESPIEVPSNVILRGVSATESILEFELTNEDHLIKVIGEGVLGDTIFVNNLYKDSLSLNLRSNVNIEAGSYVIIQDDDAEKITSSWARNSTGQIVQVVAEENNLINISSPLRRDYQLENRPYGRAIELKSNVGIESLGIRNLKQTQSQTSNIYFNNVRDSWVKCVKSVNSNYAHIEVRRGINVEISGSYFKDGFEYTGGGKAYGVMLHFTTCEVLVVNNQFEHLRHSMILQAGANGNVVAYNYSFDAFWEDPSLPSDAAGDLVLHGNYVYANLLEGNIVQNIVIDASHGINGKYNTFFRNRAERYGIFMDPVTISNGQNFIANEITSNTSNTGLYAIFGTDHFELANNQKGNIIPALQGDENIPASLFISETPVYYINSEWPAMGFGTTFNQNIIKAKDLNISNQETDCEDVEITTSIDIVSDADILVFPNPAQNKITVEGLSLSIKNFDLSIFDINGRKILRQSNDHIVDVSEIDSGIYLLVIQSTGHRILSKKFAVVRN